MIAKLSIKIKNCNWNNAKSKILEKIAHVAELEEYVEGLSIFADKILKKDTFLTIGGTLFLKREKFENIYREYEKAHKREKNIGIIEWGVFWSENNKSELIFNLEEGSRLYSELYDDNSGNIDLSRETTKEIIVLLKQLSKILNGKNLEIGSYDDEGLDSDKIEKIGIK